MPPKKKGQGKGKGKAEDEDFDAAAILQELEEKETQPAPPKGGITLGAPKSGIILGAPKSGGIVLGAPKGGITLGSSSESVTPAEPTESAPAAPKGGIVLGAPKGGIVLGAPKAGPAKGGVVLGQAPAAPSGDAATPAEGSEGAAKKKKKKKPAAAKDANKPSETKATEEDGGAAATGEAAPAAEVPAAATAKGKGKGKGAGPGAAARAKIAEQIRLQKEYEERIQRELEEQKRREEEEERREAEERRIKAEQEAELRKKRKEQSIIDKKRQEEARKAKELADRLSRLGLNVPAAALKKDPGEKKKVVYVDKKKQQKKAAELAEKQKQEEEALKAAAPVAAPVEEDIPDAWDASESDEEVAAAEPAANTATPSPTPSPVATPAAAPTPSAAATPQAAPAADASKPELRSPIVCVLGHVDTGKTKLLDKIRKTNVQDGEAGGITQQIGASYFPMETIKKQTASLPEALGGKLKYLVPGLLIIDTPGHESFTNLRARGSSLCDIAILVVDLMYGLEPQTIESIKLLRKRKTPFVVALNKIDRLYNWKVCANEGFRKAFKAQRKEVQQEFDDRLKHVIVQFAEQGLNAMLYTQNKDVKTYVSLVPTSAHSGEGIPDLLMLLVQLTQKFFSKRLTFVETVEATVLEVKVTEGFGTTIDVILSQGTIREGDKIVLCGLNGPIVTNIRALLTPQPLRELRVKSSYLHHKEIRAAQGVKIAAHELEGCVPGAQLIVVQPGDDLEELKEKVMEDLKGVMMSLEKVEQGVFVQASTLGSLEALMSFLKDSNIPVAGVNIGPISKKHVMQASTMLEKKPEYALILAFDVKVSKEAAEMAAKMGVIIFTADIIYHLFDQFTAHMEKVQASKKADNQTAAVFPVILSIFPEHIFNKRDPIILGVHIEEGTLRIGTPLCVPTKGGIVLGKVTSIQKDHVEVTKAIAGQDVAVRMEAPATDQQYTYGRQFDHEDQLVSLVTRNSIDALKTFFRDEISPDDIKLLVKLKKMFEII